MGRRSSLKKSFSNYPNGHVGITGKGFLQAGSPSSCQTNSVKVMKEVRNSKN